MSMIESLVDTIEELLRGIECEYKNDKKRVEEDLEAAETTLSHMRLELHGVDDQSDRNAYIAMMSHFKRRIGAIQKKRLTASSPSSLSSSSSHGINQSLRSRQMLQVDKQRSLIQKLKYAHRQMAQSESIGLETIDELESQNHQTRRIYQTTTEINSDLNHSRTMLNKISQWWRV